MSNISVLGFNGEYLDDTLDSYHLGNGYRSYNPTTMQFTAPDDMSPFGAGGINPYMYVNCDPINNTDPTGHFLGFAGTLLSMFSPFTLPKSWSFASFMQAGEENLINAGIDEAVDAITEVFTAGGATPAIPAINAALAPIEHAVEHDIEEVGVRTTEQMANRALVDDTPHNKTFSRQKLLPLMGSKQRSISPESVYELGRSKSGRFLLRNPKGETKVPEEGFYNYVIRTDRDVINVAEKTDMKPNGHSSLTRIGGTGHSKLDYQSVYYAGELKFSGKPTDPPFWNNSSGHYCPAAELRHTNFTTQQRELLLPDKWNPEM